MFAWFAENLATIIICAVLLAVVTAICVHLVRQKKQGKSPCGCGCESCGSCGQCRKS